MTLRSTSCPYSRSSCRDRNIESDKEMKVGVRLGTSRSALSTKQAGDTSESVSLVQFFSYSTMSSSATLGISYTFSDFNRLFNDALVTYAKETGKDLLTHPLASNIYSCDSPDAILAVLREAAALDEFRDDSFKLAKWLQLVVHGLYAPSTDSAVGVGSHTVSFAKFAIFLSVQFNSHFLGTIPFKDNSFCSRCSPLRGYLLCFLRFTPSDVWVHFRRPNQRRKAMTSS